MFMIYRRTKLHVARHTCSSHIAVKCCKHLPFHFTSHEMLTEQNFHSEFQGSVLSETGAASSTETDMASVRVLLVITHLRGSAVNIATVYELATEGSKFQSE
jgi:hypothetical protein